jgi:NAD(P)-dependent dehydrogenase (short-subunit alcohol dehydrogenase family)
MRLDLEGKVALVTGSGQGIGRAIALAFADEGVDVAVNVRTNRDAADEVAEAIRKKGRRASVYQADAADRDAVDDMVTGVIREFGRVDILVNNVGATPKRGRSIEQLEPEVWRDNMEGTLGSTFYCCQAVGRHMVERKAGNVINIASAAAFKPLAFWSGHSTSKMAVCMLTRQLAMEWARSNIRVNAIAPGIIETPRTKGLIANPELGGPRLHGIAMGRAGQPEEIASVAVFLASSLSSYMTGQVLLVDGGETDYFPVMVDWAKL